MATIKSYTDVDQSRKLAEILPLESADMWYEDNGLMIIRLGHIPKEHTDAEVPCWSLAALCNVLPSGYAIVKNYCGFYFVESRDHEKSTNIFNNPVDACVEMVIKRHVLKS